MMADDKIKTGEEEYHFAEPEPAASSTVFASEQSVPSSSAMTRNVIFILALIAVVFVVYKSLDSFFGPKKTKPKPKVVQVQRPVVVKKPIAKPMIAVPLPRAVTPSVSTQQLAGVQSRVDSNQRTLLGLTASMNQLQNQVSRLSVELGALSQSVTRVSKNLDRQQAQLIRMAVKPKPKRRVRRARRRKPSIVYYIQAVVPGRAWIKSKKGAIMTVSKGDRVPGYGRVRKIDTEHGHVVMRSGRIIRFSPQES